MRRRHGGYNPKRRIAPPNHLSDERRNELADWASYGGNPEHKRNPADYGLTPPASPRPGKTLCDADRPIAKAEAEGLVRAGLRIGMISPCGPDQWPQNVWALSDAGEIFEAQLENPVRGVYHGYPMPENDDFRRDVVREWKQRVLRPGN